MLWLCNLVKALLADATFEKSREFLPLGLQYIYIRAPKNQTSKPIYEPRLQCGVIMGLAKVEELMIQAKPLERI